MNTPRRNFIRTAAAASLVGIGVGAALPLADAAAPLTKTASVNAMDYGAVGDGHADDSAAIQNAINAMERAGGGIVQLPAGVFRLGAPIAIENDVALLGVYQGPTSHEGMRAAGPGGAQRGTVLITSLGAGSEDGNPLITVGQNSTLSGVAIFYPDQSPDTTPTPYPWTISLIKDNATVKQVELVNPYKGIYAVGCGRHLIRDVTGQPLRMGIYVDEIYDIGRIENVHWNPWWAYSQPIIEFQYRNAEAFMFGRSDWEYVYNTFSFGYRYGYRFIKTKTGVCNGNFLGIGADASWHAVFVEQCADMGLLITNGEFVSMPQVGSVSFPDADTSQIYVESTNSGAIRLVNCAFWGPAGQNALIGGKGTVGFSDCTFMGSDASKPVIEALSGNVLVRGCEFRSHRGTPIVIGAGVAGAVFTGNLIHGDGEIVNNSPGDIQVGLNSHVE